MPSSTSSSEHSHAVQDRYARQTAADRPAVAQPVPRRPVPERPWTRIFFTALAVFAVLLSGWEGYWRIYGVTPGLRNGYGLWAIQRRRIDQSEPNATVLLGGSRAYYDIQLPTWLSLSGGFPVQLAFEGTSPLTYLENLAFDPTFKGVALVSVEPSLFFSGAEDHGGGVNYLARETPSQLVGQQMSMYLIEPYLAFDDPSLSLQSVLARLPWPPRPGRVWPHEARKLAIYGFHRNAYLWDKVETDPAYRQHVLEMWRDKIEPLVDEPSPEEALRTERTQIERAARAVAQLRAHGARVLFLRLPSSGPFLEYENRTFPRSRTWEALLAATGAPGIHFEDFPELQGYNLPEWSHMTRPEAERFTGVLYHIIARDFPGLGASRISATDQPPLPQAH